MKVIGKLFLLAFLFSSLFSCKKEIDPEENLVGTWTVSKVEGQQIINGNPGFSAADNNPSGTISFSADATGQQNYSFSFLGTVYPQNDNFSWSATETEIIIDRLLNPDLVWTRIVNESNKQVASYDIPVNASQVIRYTLTLEK
ncbi:MAG: hypothetical protein H6579_10730 [Chitinophagales bacterium]|nr:hypothetical protein [Chitinophagales bacterium]